jgi:hypothetical protein
MHNYDPSSTASLADQIKTLIQRIEALETRLQGPGVNPDTNGNDQGGSVAEACQPYCALPEVPEPTFEPTVSAHRASLIRYISKKWVNGTKLRYYFFESGPYATNQVQKDVVRQGFQVWRDVGLGLVFEEVSQISEAEIRIGFLQGDGSWSYVGRDVLQFPGQSERTMNFGWDLTADPRGVDTPVHEIGHTLGFPHEHQNPFAGIEWDEEAVYRYFGAPPNRWSRQTTFNNILRQLSLGEVEGSTWDPDSIMHYSFPSGLILKPEQYRTSGIRPGLGLSQHDIAQARLFYPPLEDIYPALKPFQSEPLTLAPAEQKNFRVQPDATRTYTIQTFGNSDTVMVLFEDQNGDLRYVAGDDDSGQDRNARIRVRLYQGRKYVLRIRLYLNYSAGATAVMMW